LVAWRLTPITALLQSYGWRETVVGSNLDGVANGRVKAKVDSRGGSLRRSVKRMAPPATTLSMGIPLTGTGVGRQAMELIAAIVPLAVVAAPLALLGAWLAASTHYGAASVVPRSGEGWWRVTLPWPRGVQEENDPGWNLHQAPPAEADSSDASSGPIRSDHDVHVTRLNPRIRVR
jgi:hypothetical protein